MKVKTFLIWAIAIAIFLTIVITLASNAVNQIGMQIDQTINLSNSTANALNETIEAHEKLKDYLNRTNQTNQTNQTNNTIINNATNLTNVIAINNTINNETNLTNSTTEKPKRSGGGGGGRSNNNNPTPTPTPTVNQTPEPVEPACDEECQRERQRMLDEANQTKERKIATLQDYINNNTNPSDIPSHLLTGNIYDDYCGARERAGNAIYVYPNTQNYCNEDGLFCGFVNGRYHETYCSIEDFNRINS